MFTEIESPFLQIKGGNVNIMVEVDKDVTNTSFTNIDIPKNEFAFIKTCTKQSSCNS